MADRPEKKQSERLYDIWHGMCRRCHDPARKEYYRYGGRGIRVCVEWRMPNDLEDWTFDGFTNFKDWATEHGYGPGMTLDRVSNNRGYGPDNCRWISKRAQAYNRSTNMYITFDGKTRTLTEWSKATGLGDYVICKRLKKGWSVEKALTTPVRVVKKEDEP